MTKTSPPLNSGERGKISLKAFAIGQILLLLISFAVAIPISNITADFLYGPAAKFMSFVTGGKPSSIRLDEKGIPSVWSNRLRSTDYNPVTTSLYGLAYYQKWSGLNDVLPYVSYVEKITDASQEQYLDYFINCADWLVERLKLKSHDGIHFGVWEYDSRRSIYNLDPPWVSGMAQGLGIQVLGRAYNITRREKYLNVAKNALNAFFVEVKDGGVTYKDSQTEWWYEEYAHPKAKRSRVLNGMQLTLIGIYEYYEATSDENAKLLFEKGIESLKTNIEKYDAGWWTYYDALGLLANRDYHQVHITLTNKLYELTNEPMFLSLNKKWSRYKKAFIIREFIKQKPNYHDMVIFAFNVMAAFFVLEFVFIIILIIKRGYKKAADTYD